MKLCKILILLFFFTNLVAQNNLLHQEVATLIERDSTGWRFASDQELRVKSLPPFIVKKGLQHDKLLQTGYLNVKHYVKGDGKTDDTEMLMKALDDCLNYELVAFFPEGTYLISKSLNCFKKYKSYTKGYFLVGNPDKRPVIKLIDNAPDFQNPEKPLQVLNLWQWDIRSARPEKEFGAALMNSAGVSSIIIDCGKGNPGAIGFKCWGSQGIYVENLTVKAHGAYAGIQNLVGNGGYMANIDIWGGKYGIVASNGQPGCIAGLTLIDQDEAAIRQDMASWPYSIVGFRIIKEKGPVLILDKKNNLNNGHHLSLVDGTVEFRKPGSTASIINKNDEKRAGNLYLKNVFVKNAAVLIAEGGESPVEAVYKAGWNHIKEFVSSSSDTESFINGQSVYGSIIEVEKGKPADNFVSKHGLSRAAIPFGLDKDAMNVKDVSLGKYAAKGDGITDDTKAIQYSIDHYQKVFLPKGDFRITSPLRLGKNTVLFGITSALTAIIPDISNWKKDAERTVFKTIDDKIATTGVSQLTLYSSSSEPTGGFLLLDWKAGRNSWVKNIFSHAIELKGIGWPTVKPVWNEGIITRPVNIEQLVRVSGNGGGKWYGCAIGCENYYPVVPHHYKHLSIQNTTEPLNMYSLNPEHACSDAEVEILNSKNICIYGVKTEQNEGCEFNTFGPETGSLFSISNSDNIFISAIGNNGKRPTDGLSLFKIEDCTNTTITTLSVLPRNRGDYYNISVSNKGKTLLKLPISKNLGLFKSGKIVAGSVSDIALKPPMGWNSFDSYGVALHEQAAMKNLEALATKFKQFGYEYFVIDAGWFGEFRLQPGTVFPAEKHATVLNTNEYGLLQPSKTYFPNGLKPIIDRCHQLGLKFGIHIMRGIPRQSVEMNVPIQGTKYRAQDIANKIDTCKWCLQNYGVDMSKPGAQEFYNNWIKQLADWGVDFLKVDDIVPYPTEVEAISKAVRNSGRDIVISLSPGDKVDKKALPFFKQANMLRVTQDIWDDQHGIDVCFEAWKKWQGKEDRNFHIDMDMIPFGELQIMNPLPVGLKGSESKNEIIERKKKGELSNVELLAGKGWNRRSELTKNQMYTFITLRALAASPLMIGGDLVTMDDFSTSLLTNKEMIACNQNTVMGKLISVKDKMEVWNTPEQNSENGWIGIFNRNQTDDQTFEIKNEVLGLKQLNYKLFDVWNEVVIVDGQKVIVPANGVIFLRYKSKK